MNIKQYQKLTRNTAIYPVTKALDYLVLGLISEAGEVAGKHKKYIRGDFDAHQHRQDMIAELGDVFWYLVRICDELDKSIDEVLEQNVNKLMLRANNNTIKGDGDDR